MHSKVRTICSPIQCSSLTLAQDSCLTVQCSQISGNHCSLLCLTANCGVSSLSMVGREAFVVRVLVEAQIFNNWSINPVHSSICSSFTNGLKWCLDCIKISDRIKGSIAITYQHRYHHYHHHRHHHHHHPSLLLTNPRYSSLVMVMGNADR